MNRKSRRNKKSAARPRLGRRLLCVERLEERVLLTANSLGDQAAMWFADLGLAAPAGASAANRTDWVVQLSADATTRAGSVAGAAALLHDLPLSVVRGLGAPGLVLVSSYDTAQFVTQSLAANPLIASFTIDAQVDGAILPNDPLLTGGQQYGLLNPPSLNLDIDAEPAWSITTGSLSVVTAVIDSGVYYSHPDLYRNIWINQGEIPLALRPLLVDTDNDGLITFIDLNAPANASRVVEQANDGNAFIDGGDLLTDPNWANGVNEDGGFVDDLIGWDFRNNDNNPLDDHGHGTHVAGTIGAIGNNNLGGTGINWVTSLMPLKFLDQNNVGSVSNATAAINYATLMRTRTASAANLRAINASWGGAGVNDPGLETAIRNAGAADVLFVAAAGNGDIFGRGQNIDTAPYYPASFNLDNMLVVAATDRFDNLATFSNFGPSTVDLAAPGVSIYSTDIFIEESAVLRGNEFSTRSGTSMATPLVTGTAALMWSWAPTATLKEVRDAILSGGDSQSSLAGKVGSSKRLNAIGALNDLPPQAKVNSALDVTAIGGVSYQFTVNLTSNVGIQPATVGAGDFIVRRQGTTTDLPTTLVSATSSNANKQWTVTYQITPPGGIWDVLDGGTYEILLVGGALVDTDNGVSQQKVVDQFEVNLSNIGVFRPTVFTDTGAGSLRAAIALANAVTPAINPAGGTVILAPGVYSLSLTGAGDDVNLTGDLDITGHVTIASNGLGPVTIQANGIDRVLDVLAGGTLTLEGVTITGGNVAGDGGGIRNAGTLNMNKSTIDGNSGFNGGGAFNASSATFTVNASTISGNNALGQIGPATLDPSFGVGGKQQTTINGVDEQGVASAQQADGKIVVVGSSETGSNRDFGIVRYNVDGSLDNTFSGDGKAVYAVGSFGDEVSGVAIQADGKIIVVGNSHNGIDRDFSLIRLNVDGSLDSTFDGDGRLIVAFGSGDDLANAVAVQSDGKIVVAGVSSLDGRFAMAVMRLTPAGALDTTFNGTGKQILPLTAGGTTLVKDIRPGVDSSNPLVMTNVGGVFYFSANDGVNGEELWKSDGTAAGTVMVKDILTGGGSSKPRYLANVGGTLYFRASGGSAGYELWKSDGTAAGTVLVKDIHPTGASNPIGLTNVGGTLYFRARDGGTNYELWKSDGTAAGTTLVKDIRPGSVGSNLQSLVNVGGTLYFGADDGVNGYELWKSDGTEVGTTLVKDIQNGSGSSNPLVMTNVGGVFYFSASDGVNGEELWKSDGTAAGTVMVKDILTGGGSSKPRYLANVGGTLYFRASGGSAGYELWKSDGTAAGTVLVKDIHPTGASNPIGLTNVGGTLYFRARDGGTNYELWKSDGTAAGTTLVKDIRPGADGSNIQSLANVGGTLYFGANDGSTGNELWKSDGTAGGDYALGVAIQSDGKIVLSGYSKTAVIDDAVLVRLLPTGALDSSFGSGGVVTTPIGALHDEYRSVVLQNDGKIIVGGTTQGSADNDYLLARYNSNGSLDTSFGVGGIVTTKVTLFGDYIETVKVQSDGKIIAGGSSFTTVGGGANGMNADLSLARYNANGSLDVNFTLSGTLLVPFGTADDFLGGLSVDSQGRIVVAGRTQVGGSAGQFAIARIYVTEASGGGVYNAGTFNATNVTVSGNNAANFGGGVYNAGMLTATNVTASRNDAANQSDGLHNTNGTSASLQNTIVANNLTALATADVAGEFTSLGGNLIGNIGAATGFTQPTDQVGTSVEPINALLDELADNGGPTKTHLPLFGSRAIDKAVAGGPTTDQRGIPRPADGDNNSVAVEDVGASELYHAKISGRKFNDLDQDGVQDGNEVGIADWTMYLDLNTNGQLDAGEPTAVTNALGDYAFTYLAPGTYTVAEVNQPGWTRTYISTNYGSNVRNNTADGLGTTVTGLSIAHELALSPLGNHAYSINSSNTLADSIVSFRRNATTGDLEFIEALTTVLGTDPLGIEGEGHVVVSSDGKHVYALGSTSNAIAIFSRNLITGTLTFVAKVVEGDEIEGDQIEGLVDPRDLVLSPNGEQLYIVSSNAVVPLTRNATSGLLTYLPIQPGGGTAIAISPNGQQVYVSGASSLTTYTRSSATGILTLQSTFSNGQAAPGGGVASALADVADIAISPDGKHLYTHSRMDQSIGLYERNLTSGVLKYVEKVTRGVADSAGAIVDGLNAGKSLAISSTGDRLYATADGDESLAIFRRDASTGRLTYLNVRKEFGTDGAGVLITSLNNPDGVVVSPDGSAIYVVAREGTITRFQRDSAGLDRKTLLVGQDLTSVNFSSFAVTGEIRGAVYNDLNNNGLRDADETGLPNVTVYLDLNNSNVLDAGDQDKFVVTDQLGEYKFPALTAPHTYTVRFAAQSGQTVTSPSSGADREWSIALDPDEIFTNANFMVHVQLSGSAGANSQISGFVWQDLDGLGDKDDNEPFLVGRQVYLDVNDNGVYDSTVDVTAPALTNASGQYLFTSIGTANVAVRVVTLPGETTSNLLGNFFNKQTLTTGANPLGLVAHNLNNDTRLDLVSVETSSDTVSVRLQLPDGTFAPRGEYQVGTSQGSQPTSIAVGRFNNDAFADIAIVYWTLGQVRFLTNDGDGTFTFDTSYSVAIPFGYTTIVAGDFVPGGLDDLAVAIDGPNSQDQPNDIVRVLQNNSGANLSFSALPDISLGNAAPLSLAAGLLNGDALPDLVVGNYGSNQVRVLLNSGGTSFSAQTPVTLTGGLSAVIVTDDLSGDGHRDVVATTIGEGTVSGTVVVLSGNGTGVLSVSSTRDVSQGPRAVAVADVDGDLDLDLVVGRGVSNDVVLLRKGPSGYGAPENSGLASFASLTESGVKQVIAADFDSNGLKDLAAVRGTGTTGSLEVLRNSLGAGAIRLSTNGTNQFSGQNFGIKLAFIPGDYDRNGSITQADRTFWATHFGATIGTGLQADGNNNGLVDAADFTFWRDRLTASAASVTPATTSAVTVSAQPLALWLAPVIEVSLDAELELPTPSLHSAQSTAWELSEFWFDRPTSDEQLAELSSNELEPEGETAREEAFAEFDAAPLTVQFR